MSDVDSPGQVTASTNRSWATVDLASSTLTVNPSAVGFQSVLVSVCDQTSCTERELTSSDGLAGFDHESISFDKEELTQGDIISMRVLVRNQTSGRYHGVCSVPNRRPTHRRPNHRHHSTRRTPIRHAIGKSLDARVRFNAVVDRGLEIQEGDEDNNVLEELVAINELDEDNADSTEGLLSTQTAMIGVVLLALGLLGLIVFMMPPKIKKIQ